MRRLFSQRQKRILAWVSGMLCQRCAKPIGSQFHADHVVPYSKGGMTITNNGQALCAACNLQKGNR